MNDNNSLKDWLKTYQTIDAPDDIADPSRSAGGLGAVVQENLCRLEFDSEPSGFVRLLHQLAPKELRGE
jgi:hypothetical protein